MRRLSPRQSVRHHGHDSSSSSTQSPSSHRPVVNVVPQPQSPETPGPLLPVVVGNGRSPPPHLSPSSISMGPLHEQGRRADGRMIVPVFYVDASPEPPPSPDDVNDDGIDKKGGLGPASPWPSTSTPLCPSSSRDDDDSSCATTEETSSAGSGSSHGMPSLSSLSSLAIEVTTEESSSPARSQHPQCDDSSTMRQQPPHSPQRSILSAEGDPSAPHKHPNDRRRFELLGYELSHLPRNVQFAACASGVFCFTVVYGYLQELLSVHVLDREYALFFASCQFGLYATWAHLLRVLHSLPHEGENESSQFGGVGVGEHHLHVRGGRSANANQIPWSSIVGLGLLRAVDLGATNLSMAYLNYPAKTLLKSSRVAFTMMMGIAIGKKRYRVRDYAVVAAMVAGLLIFLNADSRADDAHFHPLGVALLVLSLLCDGAVSNYSESLMNRHNVGQDQYLFQLYSVSFLFLLAASLPNGEFIEGMRFLLLEPGTVSERRDALLVGGGDGAYYSWTPAGKVSAVLLFATTGVLGSSCAGAITKEFGALAMSVASTARKAATLFVSFAAFPDNVFTAGHGAGAALFLASLVAKSWNAAGGGGAGKGRERGGKVVDGDGSAVGGDEGGGHVHAV